MMNDAPDPKNECWDEYDIIYDLIPCYPKIHGFRCVVQNAEDDRTEESDSFSRVRIDPLVSILS